MYLYINLSKEVTITIALYYLAYFQVFCGSALL
jgi:hypothetical protein